MARRPKPRRGVLLLIVLSLLVLFLLVGLSFMVAAGQFNRLAKSAARADNTGMPGSKLADAALYQILRGTANPYSSIQGHSLLEDLYGRDYAVMQTTANLNKAFDYLATRNQMQQIRFNLGDVRLGQRLPEDGSDPQELHDDYYAGCVLTFLNGTAKGISTRVLQYKPQASAPFLVIKGVNVPGAEDGLPQAAEGQPLRFIINGRPFNGTGAGYDAQLGNLNNGASNIGVPLAFLPNYRSYRSIPFLQPFLNGQQSYNYGGLDESWDSVDYQNFFLAKSVDVAKLQQAALAIAEVEEGATLDDDNVRNLLTYYQNTGGSTPSFHRPFLIEHLKKNAPSSLLTALERAIVARPSKADHPAFTGSNPLYDPVAGPWDVDCNGDGVRDSIWIDAGLSPVAGKDGRLYKPLVATHIVDMGGRLNINAIESLERTKARVTTGMESFRTESGVIPVTGLPIAVNDNAAFGLGYGPADISTLLSGPRAPNLLRSRYAGDRRDSNFQPFETAQKRNDVPSPFAETSTPGVGPADSQTAPSNFSDDDYLYDTRPVPRIPDYYAGLAAGGEDQVTSLSGIQGSLDTGYGSPADYHARALPYLDAHGNMLWAGRFFGRFDNIDDPYEINLLSNDPQDNPFDLSDLEAIHRVDIAYEQSRAIERLVDGDIANTVGQYTTHSFSIPVPPTINSGYRRGTAVAADGLAGDGLKRSLREMFAARIRSVRATTGSNTPVPAAVAFAQAGRIMAPELMRGEKLDINRVLIPNRPAPYHSDVQRQLILDQKELFARHVFNLLMLLSDQGDGLGTGFGLPIPTANEIQRKTLHARRLAQWAINTVDFGDADSVMTMLRYDVNPFNEWEPFNLDGSLKDQSNVANAEHLQDLGIVWGMEHPEMLLTETLAFHDRRAEDGDVGMTLADGDEDLDSTMEPEGAVFFELYCARGQRPNEARWGSTVSSRAPEDLYVNQSTLNLGACLPGSKPVWRLAISELPEGGKESPKKLFESRKADLVSFEPAELDLKLTRFVWFCDQPPVKVDDEEDGDNTYYNRRRLPTLISPGSYFVVGPDDVVEVGLTRNGSASPQRISVTGNLNPSTGPPIPLGDHRRVHDVPTTRLRPTLPGRMVGMVAESAPNVGCSISEPFGGYSSGSSGTPLDVEDESPIAGDLSTRTIDDFRTVFLQRLADPTRPWNPVFNPYRTIDWMPIDLTVFNSLYDGSDDPDDPNPDNPLRDFASREKSGVQQGNPLSLPEDRFNIWSAWTNFAPRLEDPQHDRAAGQAVTATEDAALSSSLTRSANTNVVHSLGWLNRSFDYVNVIGDGLDHYRPTGPYNEAPQATQDPITGLITTFPSLVWHNRPYANPYELMMVPASSSASRATEFTVSQPLPPYSRATVPLLDNLAYQGAFGHLLNFFHSSPGTRNEPPNLLAGNYFRLFDFVAVPSPFKGTRTWYNTNRTAWSQVLWNNTTVNADSPIGLATYPAALSEFREPGKVNLNTAPDSVWAISGSGEKLGFDSLLKSWDTPRTALRRGEEFELSMAGGYPRIETDSLAANVSGRFPNGQHPAEYPNPLRSGIGADLVARLSGVIPPVPPSAADATMLRGAAADRQPILGRFALAPPTSQAQSTAYTLQNRRTNPYFRFKDLMKLGNSVTSQSNVFAVWITIGYFEIEPNIENGEVFHVDPAHPDGYRFGIEMGSDLGQVTRHRSFYVIDRSIPVAFEPGKNHNVDHAILVRHHLE